MTKKIQSRINLLRYSQSADVSGTALNQAVEMIAIPAQEKIILWTMSKTKKTPSSQLSNRTIGQMGESALMNRPQTKTRRTVTMYLPPSEDEASLGDEDFIMPEEPVDQEHFKRRLIATARRAMTMTVMPDTLIISPARPNITDQT